MYKNRCKAIILCITILLLFVSGMPASASNCTITQISDTELTVSVIPEKGRISVSVYPDGKSYADMMSADKENYNDILVYANEFPVIAGEEKVFKMDLKNCSTGFYTLIVAEKGKKTEYPFYFERRDLKRDALTLINQAETIEQVEDLLDLHYIEIGITNTDYSNADTAVIATYIYNAVKGGTTLKENDAPSDNVIGGATTLGLIKNNKLINVYDRIEDFQLANTELEGFFNAGFVTEEIQKAITEYLAKTDVSDYTKFKNSFKTAYILAVIDYSDSYSNVKKVVDKYSAYIGAGSNVSVKAFASIAGQKFASIEALKKKLAELAEGTPETNVYAGSGGGRGGAVAQKPETPPQTVEKLHVEIFTDLESVEWAKKSIVSLAEQKIINGKADALFCPNDNVTRYEFAKIVVLAFLNNAEEGKTEFTDIPEEHWANSFVKQAYSAGLIKGRDEKTFDGDANITREEMAVILLRAATAGGIITSDFEDSKNYQFKDDASIAEYAKEAVYILKYDGVINGLGDDTFAPTEYATRAQAAHMVYALSQL